MYARSHKRERESFYIMSCFSGGKQKKELDLEAYMDSSLIKACMTNWQYDIHTFILGE